MKLTRIFASICAFNYINRTETINIHINSRTKESRKELLPQDNQLQHWNDAYIILPNTTIHLVHSSIHNF